MNYPDTTSANPTWDQPPCPRKNILCRTLHSSGDKSNGFPRLIPLLVALHVDPVRPVLLELGTTDAALEARAGSVRGHVVGQRLLQLERPLAHAALVGALRAVALAVTPEGAGAGEGRAALGARVGFLPRVGVGVVPQVGRAGKPLAAERALGALRSGGGLGAVVVVVVAARVGLEASLVLVLGRAQRAGEEEVGPVDVEVAVHGALVREALAALVAHEAGLPRVGVQVPVQLLPGALQRSAQVALEGLDPVRSPPLPLRALLVGVNGLLVVVAAHTRLEDYAAKPAANDELELRAAGGRTPLCSAQRRPQMLLSLVKRCEGFGAEVAPEFEAQSGIDGVNFVREEYGFVNFVRRFQVLAATAVGGKFLAAEITPEFVDPSFHVPSRRRHADVVHSFQMVVSSESARELQLTHWACVGHKLCSRTVMKTCHVIFERLLASELLAA